MNQQQIIDSLQGLRPGAQWVVRGDAYQNIEWLDKVQTIPTEAEVTNYVPPTMDAVDKWDVVTLKVCFNHENRIRALEGKAAVTPTQFKTAIRNLVTPT